MDDLDSLIDQIRNQTKPDESLSDKAFREAIIEGLEDIRAGRSKDISEVRKRFGLSE